MALAWPNFSSVAATPRTPPFCGSFPATNAPRHETGRDAPRDCPPRPVGPAAATEPPTTVARGSRRTRTGAPCAYTSPFLCCAKRTCQISVDPLHTWSSRARACSTAPLLDCPPRPVGTPLETVSPASTIFEGCESDPPNWTRPGMPNTPAKKCAAILRGAPGLRGTLGTARNP